MNLLNIYMYIIIFIIGTVFGSFYTLAVYRIPKEIDIIKKHSYCPNCGNKLGFFELIPVLSYIFLGGKCKHCKQKIRPRYLILEILSGISFVILAIAINVNVETITISKIIFYTFIVLYFTLIVLISAIDKEYVLISRKVLAYGVIISIIYMIYLYTIEKTSIYRYIIYLLIYVVLFTMDNIFLRKKKFNSYLINLLSYMNVIVIFCEERIYFCTLLLTLLFIFIYVKKEKLLTKKHKQEKPNPTPVGYFIGLSNIIVIFILTFITNFAK